MDFPEWSSGQSKHLFRLDDGEQAVGVFRGKIERFYQHWKNGHSVICPGRDTCTLCNSEDDSDRKSTGRFRINFIEISKDQTLTGWIFEGGRKVYDQLAMINKEHPIDQMIVKIARTGKGQQTVWSIMTLPGDKGVLKNETQKKVLAVPLHELRPGAPVEAMGEIGETEDDLPF